MNKIKIAHLYYDLMNLYGENGNTRVIAKALQQQNLDVEVRFLSLEDEIDFNSYDIFYIGTGSEENQLLVLKHLKKYVNDIKKVIDDGKLFIVTGNAIELFGKKITNLNKDVVKTLGIFDYECIVTDYRIIGEQLFKTSLIDKDIIGFQNRQAVIKNCDIPLFEVVNGTGYEPDNKFEGIHKNNFFGTYLLGPMLVRNPYLLEYFIKNFMESKKKKYITLKKDVMFKAYDEYIKNFVKE